MLVFVIAVAAVMLPILFGLLIQSGMSRFDTVITETKAAIEEEEKAYNPALTLGHKVRVKDEPESQYEQARLEAAKRAASLPRGGNVRIGRQGNSLLKTASNDLDNDPLTSFKIARYHGWDGAKIGIPAGGVPAAGAVAPVAAAPAAKPGKLKLVAGKDYPVTEVTADMPGAEKRRIRIANAKAKSAAYKAAKAAGITGAPVVEAAAPVAAAAPAAAPVAAAPVGIEPPTLVEITDDMSPDDKRKARIANSKAKSAYNKALKAAGIDPKSVKAGATVQVPAAAAPVAAEPAAAAPAAAPPPPAGGLTPEAAGIAPPEYVEITDDMPPDEKRAARVANSKARSAYNKALKAAGIDPKSLKK